MAQNHTSYCHRGGDIPLLGATIPEHFSAMAQAHGDREAVVCVHQNHRLTYTELAQAVDQLARGLLGCGYQKGDRVGIWSTNNLEWLLLQLATARLGIILVTINPAYRPRELAYALQRSEVQGLFLIPRFRTSDYVAMALDLLPELHTSPPGQWQNAALPHLRQVVLYDPAVSEFVGRNKRSVSGEDTSPVATRLPETAWGLVPAYPDETQRPAPGLTLWNEVFAAGTTVLQEQLDAITAGLDRDDPINIQYTSGTTGFPKAVMLSHHNILNNAWFSALDMHLGPEDRLCAPVPFYHCFGMVLSNLLCLSVGACLVLPCEHFDALAVLQAIQQERCTALHGVPTMFIAALEHPGFHEFDLNSLRTGIMAGAPCPPSLLEKVMGEFHCPEILIGYGETEASPLTHLTERNDSLARRVTTVGRNLPHQEVKIVEIASGRTLPLGQVGEICFRGYHVMRGYYGDPGATSKAIDANGWLHSGDLGTMDTDGYVRITGRLKDMIIRAGENIYPRELEDFLFTHPKVSEVAVIGVPDDFYGEEVMAWIRLRSGMDATEEEIRAFCQGQIAHYKIPRYIWFVEEFPMTVTGKIQKFRMREMAVERLAK